MLERRAHQARGESVLETLRAAAAVLPASIPALMHLPTGARQEKKVT